MEKGVAGAWEVELLRKRLVKALEVIDPRRCRAMSFVFAGEFPLSEDMIEGMRRRMLGRWLGLYRRVGSNNALPGARMAYRNAEVDVIEEDVGVGKFAGSYVL